MEADLSEHTKLTELVSLGAVKRLQDSEDGRVVRLYITEKDKRCFRMRKKTGTALSERILAHLTEEECLSYYTPTKKMILVLEEMMNGLENKITCILH